MNRLERRACSPGTPFTILGMLCLLLLGGFSSGCQDAVWIDPEDGSVQEDPLDVRVFWSPEMDPDSLRVSLNNEEITDRFTLSATGLEATTQLDLLPGRKMLTAQLGDQYGLPYSATSIFTVTSSVPREDFPGGYLNFQCESSFVNSKLQVPGLDLDQGFSEMLCGLLPIQGIFPSGESALPREAAGPPLLYGVFPAEVGYNVDEQIPNGIALSPVELGVTLDVDPSDPEEDGNVCAVSVVMEGTIIPMDAVSASGIKAVMIQAVKQLSVSLVSEGECQAQMTTASDRDLMTFNYVAR